jgi:uncharacterized iron-regulated protein
MRYRKLGADGTGRQPEPAMYPDAHHRPAKPSSKPQRLNLLLILAGVALIAGLVSLALAHPHGSDTADEVRVNRIDPTDRQDLSLLLDELETASIIMVGETHNRYDHHLNQLAIIQGLYERGVPIAIGMEYFQRPFQAHLDDFSAGLIDEASLLERTQWQQRWGFDVRLYRDILSYAQAQRIPLVALNASSETVAAVSAAGIEGLERSQRALFPPRIELASGAYRRQLEQVFALHGDLPKAHLQRFLEVQYVWDQTMARSAGDYLTANPGRTLVILAGSGHLLHDAAIPQRLRQIFPGKQQVLVTDIGWMPEGATPHFVLAAHDISLPVASRLAERSTSH